MRRCRVDETRGFCVFSKPPKAGWINRSFALHELKRTQEACDQLHEGLLYRFRDESLIWYNLACYACVLGDRARARKMLDKAIELGAQDVGQGQAAGVGRP